MFNETLVILQRELWKAFAQTFVMMGISFVLSLILGLALGFVLYLTETPAFYPKKSLNAVAAAIVNFIRSIPFIILVVFTLPFTFWLVGTKIGPIAASVPMTISATVFLARLVESSLKETDPGVIEAAL
ncbi:MAG: ABC transporter permease, partial [Succinivibrio sp.]|nr:ABC transporter permease [Succinivibrio sp.]